MGRPGWGGISQIKPAQVIRADQQRAAVADDDHANAGQLTIAELSQHHTQIGSGVLQREDAGAVGHDPLLGQAANLGGIQQNIAVKKVFAIVEGFTRQVVIALLLLGRGQRGERRLEDFNICLRGIQRLKLLGAVGRVGRDNRQRRGAHDRGRRRRQRLTGQLHIAGVGDVDHRLVRTAGRQTVAAGQIDEFSRRQIQLDAAAQVRQDRRHREAIAAQRQHGSRAEPGGGGGAQGQARLIAAVEQRLARQGTGTLQHGGHRGAVVGVGRRGGGQAGRIQHHRAGERAQGRVVDEAEARLGQRAVGAGRQLGRRGPIRERKRQRWRQ